jgi:hypothetical protein
VRRIANAALGGLAGCALVLGGTQAASGALSTILKVFEDTQDLRATTSGVLTSDALDSAKAKITIAEGTGSTTFKIRVTDIDPSIDGIPLGAHLHIGECVDGQPGAAGPHYNHQVALDPEKTYPDPKAPAPLPTDADVNTDTEVWFDLESTEDGMAYDATTVPFVPVDANPLYVPGVMSIVIHERETDSLGVAGLREVCFPLSVPPHWVQ